MQAVLDLPALLISVAIALVITAVLMRAHRGDDHRKGWIAAGVVTAVLIAIGMLDLARANPRETHFSTVIVAAALPVVGTLGMIRATRRVRPWVRWLMAFGTAFVLFFAGLLIGATLASRLLPI